MTSTKLPDRGLGAGPASLPYLPALDGLRGLAVAAVFLFHSEYGFARGGFLGVSAFFTLSGFLITTLLLVERDATGRINFRAFWARRARRLLPAAYLTLFGVLLYGAFVASSQQLETLRGDVLSALAYVANWRFVFGHQSYAEIFNGTPSPVLHFWSLAIEEQFYLFFPLVAAFLLWAGRGRARVFAAALVALTVGSIVLGRVLGGPTSGEVTRVYYGTDTRAAELLIGALLALFLVGRRRPSRGTRVTLGALGTVSFVTMLFLWSHAGRADLWLYNGGLALHALLVAAVLAEALLPGPLSAALRVPPLRFLGRISYGVYLIHWPVFLWLSPQRLPAWNSTQLLVVRSAVTFTLATASFYVLEQPVRTGHTTHRRWPKLVAPVALVTLVAIAFGVTAPTSSRPDEITFAPISKGAPPRVDGASADAPSRSSTPVASRANVQPPTTTTVPPRRQLHRPLETNRPLRVLVVGDSVGQTFGRGVELWGQHTGRALVWNDAHFFCGLARYAPRVFGVGESHQMQVCDEWGTRWPQEVQRFDPDVVVMLWTFWEVVMRKPPGVDHYLAPGDPVYDNWQHGEYLTAIDTLSQRGAKVVWLTMPCRQGDTPDATQMVHRYNDVQLRAVAKQRPNVVRIVDLDRQICPHDAFSNTYGNVTDARPDGAHFSDAGAEAVANWLMSKVLAN